MIEQALLDHLRQQQTLTDHLASYAGFPAIFSQEAPSDKASGWKSGPQYGRIVFTVDLQGDPERTMGGILAVDIMCKKDKQFPEDIEPIVRSLIHGYFFSAGTFTMAAQYKNSAYFTQPTDQVSGCTLTFELLGFPVLTTSVTDVIARINEWSDSLGDNIHVINHKPLPAPAWKPESGESAVYWRRVTVAPARWIPDTFQTVWRTATIKGHIFSETPAEASELAEELTLRLYAAKRLLKAGDAPIMVNRNNTTDNGADPLRTGQVTVEATYGVIVYRNNAGTIQHIHK